MIRTLYDLVTDAIADLRDWRHDNPGEEPHDQIHEIADASTPIYTADLLRLAADHIRLATDEPELGPAFDGSPTPANIIAANIFEYLEQALWEAWGEIEDEEEDDDDNR